MKSIIAFGNPLLDITIRSKSHVLELLKKYNLKIDGQKEISYSQMNNLCKDIEGLEQHISPGGCSQNSLRVLQWILDKKCNASIFGSVGKDREADILRNVLKSEGVETRYIVNGNLPTGKTIALVSDFTRSLVAHIGAAEVFSLESLLAYPNFKSLFNTTDIVFIEAYFLTHRFETTKYLVELCQKENKLLVFNLCGDYIFRVIPEPIKYLVKHANLIFGNRAEYIALTTLFKCTSLEQLAENLTKTNRNETPESKTLVITDGPNAIVAYSQDKKFKIEPPRVEISEIKDTTAAGDAFIGGFLAAFAMLQDIEQCINIGIYAAVNIIKQSGCTLPKYPAVFS